MSARHERRSSFIPRLAPAALVPSFIVLGAVSGFLRLEGWSGWSAPEVIASTVLLGVAAVGTWWATVRDQPGVRRGLATGLVGVYAGMLLLRLGGLRVHVEAWTDPRLLWVSLGLAALGLGGLAGRRRWGRWLTMGLAFAGFGSAFVNAVVGTASEHGQWLHTAYATGCALVVWNLAGDRVAAEDWDTEHDALWRMRSPLVGWLRAAIVSAFVAVPMLLVYAWVQPGRIPSLVGPAVALGVAIATCTALTVRGKVIGALGLVVSGFGLLVLTFAGFASASVPFERDIAMYYLVFWAPVSVCTMVAGVELVRSICKALGPAADA